MVGKVLDLFSGPEWPFIGTTYESRLAAMAALAANLKYLKSAVFRTSSFLGKI